MKFPRFGTKQKVDVQAIVSDILLYCTFWDVEATQGRLGTICKYLMAERCKGGWHLLNIEHTENMDGVGAIVKRSYLEATGGTPQVFTDINDVFTQLLARDIGVANEVAKGVKDGHQIAGYGILKHDDPHSQDWWKSTTMAGTKNKSGTVYSLKEASALLGVPLPPAANTQAMGMVSAAGPD